MAEEVRDTELTFDNFDAFYLSLEQEGLIRTTLYRDIINMLAKLNDSLKENESIKMFLALFFVYFENGNICIPLNEDGLKESIDKFLSASFSSDTSKFINKIFNNGISFIKDLVNKNNSQKLIQKINKQNKDNFEQITPFVLYESDGKKDYLYPAKFFRAKLDIENRIDKLFGISDVSNFIYKTTDDYNSKIEEITIEPFTLNKEQFDVVKRGFDGESLFITGGAGTGKTTAVFYLLKELVEKNSLTENDIFLVAPSGKAADRLTESIINSLKKFKKEIVKKSPFCVIEKLKGSTIHSLLHYSLKDNRFEYNRTNPVGNEKSIFVIDEASMIDVLLFSDLLTAIPDGAKVYILGDPNQLPSVDAGAVLGSLLDIKNDAGKNHTVHLVESKRFDDSSVVSNLAKCIIEEDGYSFEEFMNNKKEDLWRNLSDFNDFENRLNQKDKQFPVFCFDLNSGDEKNAKKANLAEILKSYFNCFYKQMYLNKEVCFSLADLQNNSKNTKNDLKKIFEIQENARILSANRSGDIGCESLNKLMIKQAKSIYNKYCDSYNKVPSDQIFFPGVLVIITKNIKNLDLFNGDNGIVVGVRSKDDNKNIEDSVVFKKPKAGAEDDDFLDFPQIYRLGDYMFYPLSLIPTDSIELAYAITIHKSQGSGYNNILMFLPEDKNSPLLNRQILYTGITRTKGNTYIVSSVDNLKIAQKNNIKRWTEIQIKEKVAGC